MTKKNAREENIIRCLIIILITQYEDEGVGELTIKV